MSNEIIKQQVDTILNKCREDLQAAIGKPVNVLFRIKINNINPHLIINNVLAVIGVTYSEMISKSREQQLVTARTLVMWLVNTYCGFSHGQIADLVNRDRTTVTVGLKQVSDFIENNDPVIMIPLLKIEKRLLEIIKEEVAA